MWYLISNSLATSGRHACTLDFNALTQLHCYPPVQLRGSQRIVETMKFEMEQKSMMIRDLVAQISELQQSQVLPEKESQQELPRQEATISMKSSRDGVSVERDALQCKVDVHAKHTTMLNARITALELKLQHSSASHKQASEALTAEIACSRV
jgi:hypothetical protein